MEFPYGKAPLAIGLIALLCSAILWVGEFSGEKSQRRPDLVFGTFVKKQADAYRPAIQQFERDHNVKIQVQEQPQE